ncbi:MAG: hypothetical protein ACR2QF_07485, partial [Geminicoccaceae bacterium]
MQMPRHLLSLPAIMALGFATATANAAEKTEYTCRSGETVRRVIVEVGDFSTGLPCEVVYWKDSEAPGVRRVLWNARSDARFCQDKAAGLVAKLDDSGWNCDEGIDRASLNGSTSEPQLSSPSQPDVSTSTAAVPTLDAATVAKTPQPAATQTANAVSTPSAATSITSTSPASLDSGNSSATDSAATQTAALTAPPPEQATEQLQSVIKQNLESLNKSVDGDFKAEVGRFGDLNADGLEDAVVFFNYQSSTADFTQFVAAYLFNGDSYHLAATKPVGGTERSVQKVEVENIIDGSILLKLHLNDASQTE